MTSTHSLFREEAIQARSTSLLGEIRIRRQKSLMLSAGLSLLLLLAAVAYLMLGEVSRKSRVGGFVMPGGGLVPVAAQTSGYVQELLVAEGAFVSAGQPLAVILSAVEGVQGRSTADAKQARLARFEALTREQAIGTAQMQRSADMSRRRILLLASERQQVQSELANTAQRIDLARLKLAQQEQLRAQGFVSEQMLNQARGELLDIEFQAATVRRSLLTLDKERAALEADEESVRAGLEGREMALTRERAALTQEELQLESREVSSLQSPVAGRVGAVYYSVGHWIQPGQALLALRAGAEANDERLEIHLYAPARAMGFVSLGQAVRLKYSAFPFQKFGLHRGVVSAISDLPTAPADLPSGQAQALFAGNGASEPLYRITVRPDSSTVHAFGKEYPIRVGLRVEAELIHERRAVWEWLLEPLFSVAPRSGA